MRLGAFATESDRFIQWASALVAAGKTWAEAASEIATKEPELVRRVRDTLGSWPSSDPALRALQEWT